MAQISYGSITVSDVTDIENVYFEYALAKSDASETSIKAGTYTFSQTGERGWSTTYPTWTRGYQIWVREVKKYANIDNVVTLTPYLDKAVNDLNNIVDNIDIDSLQTKLKYIWVNTNNNSHPRGTYAASGREQESTPITFDINDQSTYGFNTHLAHNALDLRYNNVKMTSLTTGALTFYVPMYKNGSYVQGGEGLILNANGLRLFTPYNYRLSEDTSLDPNKTYYVYTELDGVPTYTPVVNPNPNPRQENYYEWTTAAVLNQNGLNITEGSITLGEEENETYPFRVTNDGYLRAQAGWIGGENSYVKLEKSIGEDEEITHYLDIRLSQLEMLLGDELYGQENIVEVLDIIGQQVDFINLWNGQTVWKYENEQDESYDVYQYVDAENGETRYYYNENQNDEGTYELSTDTTVQDNTVYYKKTINNTSSNDIIEVTKYQDAKINSLTASIEPAQFFNGYSKPWVGGAGKNKIDVVNRTESASASLSTYQLETCSVVKTGGTYKATSTGAWSKVKFGISGLKENQTYTFSALFSNPSGGRVGVIYLKSGSWAPAVTSTATSARLKITFTYTSDITILALLVNNTTENTGYEVTINEIQLEEGSSQTTYAPYENICPISGTSEVKTIRTNENLAGDYLTCQINASGVVSSDRFKSTIFKVKSGQKYTVKGSETWAKTYAFFDHYPSVGSVTYNKSRVVFDNTQQATFTAPIDGWCIFRCGVSLGVYEDIVSVTQGETATDQTETTTTYTTDLGRTVYGGTLDVTSGVLTVDRISITYDGSNDEAWQYYSVAQGNLFRITQRDRKAGTIYPLGVISNRFETVANANRRNGTMSSPTSGSEYAIDFIYDDCNSVTTWKTWLSNNNIQVVYPLATPQTYNLTPRQINLLIGTNNLWVNSGKINVQLNLDYEIVNPQSNPQAEGFYELIFEEENWIEFTGDIQSLPSQQKAGLGRSLRFTDDSLGQQQRLVVSSSRDDELEKAGVEIDPLFLKFLIQGDDIAPFEFNVQYNQDMTSGELVIKSGENTIFSITDENNYMLDTTTGVKFGPLGLFHYKNGLAIGLV